MNAAARNSIIGAGIGAGLILLLDPVRGNRRRARILKAGRKSFDAAGAAGRDVANRLQGVRARAGNLISRAPVDDAVMVERIRARLGRVASHPRAIDVHACNGCITLTGDVLASEVVSIMNTIAGMRGVVDVENQMTTHASSTHVPTLQRQFERPSRLKSGWSPAAMLACGVTAAAAFGGAAMMRARRTA